MNNIQFDTVSVHLVGSGQISAPNDCCIYLVSDHNTSGSSILIDAGAGSNQSIKTITQSIEEIEPLARTQYILVTHAHIDHVGGLKAMKSLMSQAKIIAHSYAAEVISNEDPVLSAAKWYRTKLLSTNIDIEITQPYKIKLDKGNFKIIPTPGHTPGSVVGLLTIENKRILFGQDIHGPFMPEFNSDMDQWRHSMRKILELQPDYLCEGHFGIIKGKKNVKQFIGNYLKQFS